MNLIVNGVMEKINRLIVQRSTCMTENQFAAEIKEWKASPRRGMFNFSPYIREFLSNTTQLFFWKVHTSTVLSFSSNRFHNNYLLLNSLKILPKSLHFRF